MVAACELGMPPVPKASETLNFLCMRKKMGIFRIEESSQEARQTTSSG